jgi:hypothetical protein
VANFSSPRANVVQGDNGVSVEVLGRTEIRYSEPGRSCLVDSEVLATPAIAVWAGGIRSWDPPHANDPLSDDDRRRILQNIAEAFASQGWGLEVIDARTDDDRRRIAQNLADTVAAQGWNVKITDRRDSP